MRGRKEIYTKDFVTKELTWMTIQLKKNKELIFIAELFADKPYTTQRYSEWRNKFKDCEEIQELMAKIEEELAREIEELRKKARKKLLSKLTLSQRDKLEEIIGDNFQFSESSIANKSKNRKVVNK